jgi:hypothetical protein
VETTIALDGGAALWLEIAVRVLVAAYIGVAAWLTVRILQRAGIDWWWVAAPWAPSIFWVVPGIEIIGLFLVPVPIVFTWIFAFAEWPALIDTRSMGRRRRRLTHVEVEEQSRPLTLGSETQLLGGHRRSAAAADGGAAIEPPATTWLLTGFDDEGRVVRLVARDDDLTEEEGRVVGRNPQQAQLIISDDSVSRRHARLRAKSGKLLVEDLDSANGTLVNGERIAPNRPISVERGATIEFGAVKLTISRT